MHRVQCTCRTSAVGSPSIKLPSTLLDAAAAASLRSPQVVADLSSLPPLRRRLRAAAPGGCCRCESTCRRAGMLLGRAEPGCALRRLQPAGKHAIGPVCGA